MISIANPVIDQYERNVRQGPHYSDVSSLSADGVPRYPVRYIAYYLPQFHRCSVNDEAWGAGFTEWTNVTKALPRYNGHYQPRLPADLGFYNLQDVDVIRSQAALAKRAGIFGFCIHYYWFSGRKVLESPLKSLLRTSDIDLPFCINWANESWTRRWDGSEQTVLLKQEYAQDDALKFAEDLVEIMQDRRYIRVDGRPLLMVYRPAIIPNLQKTIETWRKFLVREGVGDPYLVVPQVFGAEDPKAIGFDAAAGFPPHKFGFEQTNERWWFKLLDPNFVGTIVSYEKLVEAALSYLPNGFPYFPGVSPSWDNEARKPRNGFSLFGASPQKYEGWLKEATKRALLAERPDERVLFINAWNEWAEGAYLEPDRYFGYAYLSATRRVFDAAQNDQLELIGSPNHEAHEMSVKRDYKNMIRNLTYAAARRLSGRTGAGDI